MKACERELYEGVIAAYQAVKNLDIGVCICMSFNVEKSPEKMTTRENPTEALIMGETMKLNYKRG